MLRKMLMGQYLANLDFTKLLSRDAFELLCYARGFLQIKEEDKNKIQAIKAEIIRAYDDRLLPLPDYPDGIAIEILEDLPFSLPIKHRSHPKGMVTALRRLYKFRLPPGVG